MSELLAMRGADGAKVSALVPDSNRMNARFGARGQHRGVEPEAGGLPRALLKSLACATLTSQIEEQSRQT